MNEPILIIGSGAMACLFAARLAASGKKVRLLDEWQEGIDTINKSGLRYWDEQGKVHTYQIQASTDPSEFENIPLAVVLVKSWQTQDAAEQLAKCLAPDGIVLTLQNGLGNDEILSETLGRERIAVGVTTTGATLTGSGQVRINGEGNITIGEHARIQPLVKHLREAGFDVSTQGQIASLQWGKLLVNAAVNPLTALLEVPNGQLLDNQSALALIEKIIKEVKDVTSALKISLPYDTPFEYVCKVLENTSGNYSSMLQDILRGAPTEIDAINGAVVRYGDILGIITPMNRALSLVIKAKLKTKFQNENEEGK